ncbi:MAG: NADP-dependent oxidoreductase domain-containing protein [Olpidium bornovanus]|uniref:NADP-dependent oxidoreductase domain-containing protein n=1 Tax=Olpidium bornovanus TaxID=278681 RepID=A0A8H7ZX62_9FUNG|nr:MAG: NADP-dependent oxidoreductase domain-containing protein [Olpidium bornovanus]
MAGAVSRRGRDMPAMIYGTAWKGQATSALVVEAVRAGFRGIDPACQPKHYQEHLVGDALEALSRGDTPAGAGAVPRDSLYLQTKFTSLDGQDPSKPLPYDPEAPVDAQVHQSVAKSLSNLKTSYLDAVLLHSPLRTHALTMQAWRALELEVDRGRVLRVGLSNCYDLRELRELHAAARVKPAVLQNRFYPDTGWDREVRAFCRCNGITYQSFWTLTGNRAALASHELRRVAARTGLTPEGVWFKFVQMLGIVPLNGTTSRTHMKEDLELESAPALSDEDFAALKAIIGEP